MINTMMNGSAVFPVPTSDSNGAEGPSADEVRRQLQRIIASKDFVSSERNRRFLQHVVESYLRGQSQCPL